MKLKFTGDSPTFIGNGNFGRNFAPQETAEIENPAFADFLLRQHPFEAVIEEPAETQKEEKEQQEEKAANPVNDPPPTRFGKNKQEK